MPGSKRRVQYDAVIRLMVRFRREAERCGKGRAYLGGCVMVGAAVEATLVAMTRMFPHQLYARGQKVGVARSLGDLVQLAESCGWLRGQGLKAAHRIKDWRNKIHTDRVAVSMKLPSVTRRVYDARLKDLDRVSDALYGYVV